MTTMTATATQVYQVFVKASPEQIWDAITKPEFTTKYFHGAVLDSAFEPGAPYRGFSADRSVQFVDGEVLEVRPPTRLVTTWKALWDPDMAAEPAGRVTWEIDAQEGGFTRLTVVHDDLAESPKTAESVGSATGWPLVLSGLKTLLETGEPLAS